MTKMFCLLAKKIKKVFKILLIIEKIFQTKNLLNFFRESSNYLLKKIILSFGSSKKIKLISNPEKVIVSQDDYPYVLRLPKQYDH